jgi:hypothetical protein
MLPPLSGMPTAQGGSQETVIDSAREGLRQICAALATEQTAANAGAQIGGALRRLMCPWVALGPAESATSLARKGWFAALVREMAGDAQACVEAYNAAAASHPKARIRPLAATNGRVELPLWRCAPGQIRWPVYSDEAQSVPPVNLAPRALMLTAALRLADTDLFVHGVGGGVYERVTDAWIGAWRPSWRLAPTVVASANVYMPMEAGPLPTPEEISRAAWFAHRVKHDPALAGDDLRAAEKGRLLAEIAGAMERGEKAAEHYRRMHTLLAEYREAHASALAAAGEKAASLAGSAALSGVVYDRTWSFALLPEGVVRGLREQILREFGVREEDFARAGFTQRGEGDIVSLPGL